MEALMMLVLTAGALPQAPVPPQAPPMAHPVCEECGFGCKCVNCGCGVRRPLPENPTVTYRWEYPAQVTTHGILFQPARPAAPQPQFIPIQQQPAFQPRPAFQFYPAQQQVPQQPRQPLPLLRPIATPIRAAAGGC